MSSTNAILPLKSRNAVECISRRYPFSRFWRFRVIKSSIFLQRNRRWDTQKDDGTSAGNYILYASSPTRLPKDSSVPTHPASHRLKETATAVSGISVFMALYSTHFSVPL